MYLLIKMKLFGCISFTCYQRNGLLVYYLRQLWYRNYQFMGDVCVHTHVCGGAHMCVHTLVYVFGKKGCRKEGEQKIQYQFILFKTQDSGSYDFLYFTSNLIRQKYKVIQYTNTQTWSSWVSYFFLRLCSLIILVSFRWKLKSIVIKKKKKRLTSEELWVNSLTCTIFQPHLM